MSVMSELLLLLLKMLRVIERMLKYSPTLALELGIGPGQYIDGRGRRFKQEARNRLPRLLI